MNSSTEFKLLAVAMFFVMAITLGGLGTIAVKVHFYWLAFIANIFVYVCVIWNLYRAAKSEEAKEFKRKEEEGK